jgi:hypothetical protein
MKVNITLVTTNTWPADGPLRRTRAVVMVSVEAGSGKSTGKSGRAISTLFRGQQMVSAHRLMITAELQRDRQGLRPIRRAHSDANCQQRQPLSFRYEILRRDAPIGDDCWKQKTRIQVRCSRGYRALD